MFNNHKSNTTRTFDSKTFIGQMKIMNGNILYLTHEIDQIKLIVQKIHNTVNLKQQSLDYYGDDSKRFVTPPQTDSEEQ